MHKNNQELVSTAHIWFFCLVQPSSLAPSRTISSRPASFQRHLHGNQPQLLWSLGLSVSLPFCDRMREAAVPAPPPFSNIPRLTRIFFPRLFALYLFSVGGGEMGLSHPVECLRIWMEGFFARLRHSQETRSRRVIASTSSQPRWENGDWREDLLDYFQSIFFLFFLHFGL